MASSYLANYITVNVEIYSCPCAHYGDIYVDWGFSSTHSYPRQYIEYNSQPQAPTVYLPGISPVTVQ